MEVDQQLAGDHLAGKADVVVGVLLPHPDLLRASYRQSLDPDAQGPGSLALVHLQNQRRLAAALSQQADDLIGQNGVVAAAKADDLHVL